jgi:hypothetical protein
VSFNGSGLFQINTSGQPVVAATAIDPTVFNDLTADLATGLSNCVTKDGQTTVTANIPMATYKFTGLGAGTARTDSASLANVQDGTGVYVATVGGTADVITLTASPAITAYAAGQTFRFIASGANTTNVTVNVSGLGAKAVTKNGTTALAAGDIPSGMMVEITYDGTRFILESAATSTINSPAIIGGTMTQVPITVNSQSAAYTTVLGDGGKFILHPTADNNARTFTIDSNANVAYPVGTTITFVNQINTVTIAITSDTLTLAGAGSTGSRTLAANGIATALKISSTGWVISGTGLS